MTGNWEQLRDALVDGKYALKRCLSSSENAAIFLTELSGEPPRSAAIRLVRSDTPISAELLSRWSLAVTLAHPHLVAMFAAGQARLEGVSVMYAVMEYSEDNLGSVLRERPLTEAEAVDVIKSITSVLEYLHGHGYAHGHIQPSNIMSVGETIKISCDGISRIDDKSASPPADVYALGLTVIEMFTERPPQADVAHGDQQPDLARIPPRLHEMIRGCLKSAPAERWTVERIRESIAPAIDTMAPPAEPRVRPALNRKWFYAAALAAMGVVLALVLSRNVEHPPATAPLRPAPAASAPVPEASIPPSRPASREPASTPPHANWRLVAYTYNKLEHATKKQKEINRRWPGFKAEVFSLHGNQPPYLVTLGGLMPREDAFQLRTQALRAGLPKDMYVQNYSH